MASPQIRVHDSVTDAQSAAVWSVYEAVFGDYPGYEEWREAVWDRHRVREGFWLAQAYQGNALVGFAYGYTGQYGQWWTDNAAEVLGPEVADAWLGGHFEVVSLAVLSEARGTGIGRGLLRALCEGLEHQQLLLMTTFDASDPARRLYATEGWRVIGPGIGESTVIMGRRAPQNP